MSLLAPHFAGDGALSYVVDFNGAPYSVSGVHLAFLTVQYAGRILTGDDAATIDVGFWLDTLTAPGTAHGLYEVHATQFSGDPPEVGGGYALAALGTWYDLGTTSPTWGYATNHGAAKACQLDISIRRKADFVVVATTRASFSASGGP